MRRKALGLGGAVLLIAGLAGGSFAQTSQPSDGSDQSGAPTDQSTDNGMPPDSNSPPGVGMPDDSVQPTDQPSSAATTPPGGGDPYAVQLATLEEKVNTLKNDAWQVKARVDLLKETVLHGTIGGSRALIAHDNQMGGAYKLTQLTYALDGVQIFSETDDSDHIADEKQITIFDGQIVPGQHLLSVLIIYTGNGYGPFSYMNGYTYTVNSSQAFTAAEGKQTKIDVAGYEQGNFTTPLDKRPAVNYTINVVDDASLTQTGSPAAPAGQ
jgi:hypothetical protein